MIVEASEEDNQYRGNMSVNIWNDNGKSYFSLYTVGDRRTTLQYSLNGSDYIDFSNYYGVNAEIPANESTLIVRNKEDEKIYLKCIFVYDGDLPIAIVDAKAVWSRGKYIVFSYDGQNSEKKYKYSLDGGNTFSELLVKWWYWDDYYSKSEYLDSDIDILGENFVLHTNNDGLIHKVEIEEIQEEYIYENGKTTVNFKVDDIEENKIKYEYIINEEINEGNSFILEEDSNVKLKVSIQKLFSNLEKEKSIEVKVIKVEEPNIEIDENNNLVITSGNIINDELGMIYYSLDGAEDIEYTESIVLPSGTHTIKAYQVSKDKSIKSEEVEKEFIIEEIKEENDEKDTEKEIEKNNQKQDSEIKENKIQNEDEISENKEEVNIPETKSENKDIQEEKSNIVSQDKNPITGDYIVIIVIVIVIVIIINIIIMVINNNKKKKKKEDNKNK